MASPGSIRMGRGHVEIGADLNPLQQALTNAQNKVQALGANLMATGMKVIGAGVAMATPLGMAVMQFATFEQSLANLRAAANPTGAEFAKLKTQIEQVALSTGEMPADVAKVYGELIKGGMTAEQVLSGLGEATVMFARVSELPTADAAVALIDAMNIFKGMNPSQIMNTMSAAADASTISLAEVAMAFARGGSAAGLFNQKMEDVATAIAVLGKAGIKGEEAGTMIKTMLSRIASGGEGAAEGFALLGLSTASFRDAGGNLKPIQEMLAIIEQATKGLDLQTRDEALSKIGGMRGIQGFGAFLNSGAAGWAEMRKQMQGNLTVEQKFDIMTNTLAGNFKRLLVSVSIVAIAIGEALEPALSAIGAVLGPVLAFVADFIRHNQGIVVAVGAAAAALVALGAALIFDGARVWLVGGLLGMLAKVVSTAGLAVTFLGASLKVFGLIGTGVSAVVAMLTTGFGLFAIVASAWNVLVAIGTSVMGAWGTVTGAVTALIGFFTAGTGAATIGTTLWSIAMNVATAGLGLLAAALVALPIGWFAIVAYQAVAASGAIAKASEDIRTSLSETFASTWERAKETFGKISETAMAAFQGVRDAMKAGDMDVAWDVAKSAAQLAFFDISAFANDMFLDWKFTLLAVFQSVADAVQDMFFAAWDAIRKEWGRNAPFVERLLGVQGGQSLLNVEEIRGEAADRTRDNYFARRQRDADLAAQRAEAIATAQGLSPEAVRAAGDAARQRVLDSVRTGPAMAEPEGPSISGGDWGPTATREQQRQEYVDAFNEQLELAETLAWIKQAEIDNERLWSSAAAAPSPTTPTSLPDLGAAMRTMDAMGSWSGTQISGFGVQTVDQKILSATEEVRDAAQRTNDLLASILSNGGGVLLA